MPTQTTDLFLLEDLEDLGKTSGLADSDLDALHAVADWIESYVVQPHKDLGRAGPVCPFVPGALNVKRSGLLQSRPPTGTCRQLSSSWTPTGNCSWKLDPLTATTPNTR